MADERLFAPGWTCAFGDNGHDCISTALDRSIIMATESGGIGGLFMQDTFKI
jgi:hypothetical protein